MKKWYIYLMVLNLLACSANQYKTTVVNFDEIKNTILYPSVKIITSHGLGSGTIIGRELLHDSLIRYYVLTAKHVVEEASKQKEFYIRIELFDFNGYSTLYRAGFYIISGSVDAAILFFDTEQKLFSAKIAQSDSPIYTPVNIVSCHEAQYSTLSSGFITANFSTCTLSKNEYTIFSNVSFGSSGGGVFDANTNELTAIIVAIARSSQNTALSYYVYALKISEIKQWLKNSHQEHVFEIKET